MALRAAPEIAAPALLIPPVRRAVVAPTVVRAVRAALAKTETTGLMPVTKLLLSPTLMQRSFTSSPQVEMAATVVQVDLEAQEGKAEAAVVAVMAWVADADLTESERVARGAPAARGALVEQEGKAVMGVTVVMVRTS